MTTASETTLPPKPRRWRIWVPTLLVLVLAAAWSGAWWWASAKAGETVDVWLKREASRGRIYACGERKIGGYPFRIEVDCVNPTARIPADAGEAHASAPRFLAVAQVWDPRRVIGELTGPIEIVAPDGTKSTLTFSLAQASARVDGRTFERGSLALTTPRLVTGDAEIGTAASIEAHIRRAPKAGVGVYDIAGSLEGGVSPLLDMLPVGQGPVAAEFQGQASGLDDLRPGPATERLRAFAEAGGRLTITRARIARGDVAAEAKGDLGLDPEGRLNGGLDIAARGVEALVNAAIGGDGDDAMSSIAALGAKMLGKKVELDGKPATRYRLKLDKGKVSLGPIKLTRLPPVF